MFLKKHFARLKTLTNIRKRNWLNSPLGLKGKGRERMTFEQSSCTGLSESWVQSSAQQKQTHTHAHTHYSVSWLSG